MNYLECYYNIINISLVTVSRGKKLEEMCFIKFSPTYVVFENPLLRDNSFHRLTCPSFVHLCICTSGAYRVRHSPPAYTYTYFLHAASTPSTLPQGFNM